MARPKASRSQALFCSSKGWLFLGSRRAAAEVVGSWAGDGNRMNRPPDYPGVLCAVSRHPAHIVHISLVREQLACATSAGTANCQFLAAMFGATSSSRSSTPSLARRRQLSVPGTTRQPSHPFRERELGILLSAHRHSCAVFPAPERLFQVGGGVFQVPELTVQSCMARLATEAAGRHHVLEP